MATIDRLLHQLIKHGGSDLHLRAAQPPCIRVHGVMAALPDEPTLSADDCREMIREITPDVNWHALDADWDTDFAYQNVELGRFRVNALLDHHGMGAVLRTIPTEPLTAEQLNLPPVVREFCYLKKGLVVVTGPTGSGKSTTLAAMIDLINKTRSDHIITIEDPIEFVHPSRKCLVTQREVNVHTRSFTAALRAALREDPDIVLVGEMRDLETTEIAIETAETGHLVFGTLHTNTAASTVDRIIDKFPAARQNQIRSMLAGSLRGIIAQTLCKRADGRGRVAAMEILVVTTGIAGNIRDGKTHQIPSAMQVGKGIGMRLFDEDLFNLLQNGQISFEEAHSHAMDKDNLAKRAASLGIRVSAPAQRSDGNGENGAVQERRQSILNTYLEVLKQEPDNAVALNNLAWLLATAGNPGEGTAEDALAMAERANTLTNGQHAGILDTLGAAHARIGRFDKAIASARKGLKLARSHGQHELAAALEKRIALYEQGRPMLED